MILLAEIVGVSVAEPDPAWGFGLGGVMFALSLTALWPAVHLRGRAHKRLRVSVDLAFAGLAERAVEYLRVLHAELETLLPEPSSPFDPIEVVADPSSVGRAAKRGVRVLKERGKIHTRFTSLLRVCSVLKYFAAAFMLLVLSSTAAYFFAFTKPSVWQTLGWLAGCAALGAGVLAVVYSALDALIQRSIEDSDPVDDRDRVPPRIAR